MKLKSPTLKDSVYFFISLLLLYGCGLFTFSGTSLTDDVKTFSIQTFYTEVSEGPTDMPRKLTEALEEKILQNTNLTKEEKNGDLQFEGTIKSFSYKTTYKTNADNQSTEIERLTITIEVSYFNPSDEESAFKKKAFSASEDMLSTENKLDKEAELVKKIFDQLADEICRKSIDNW